MIIQTKNLKKIFKQNNKNRIIALDNVSIDVRQAEIFGFLGPNGAGKSTFIKTLLGVVLPTEGTIKLFDKSTTNPSVKKKIGYLPENLIYPEFLTGEKFLNYYGKLSSMETAVLQRRINYLVETFELGSYIKQKIKYYSKGVKQLLGIAQALLNDPELILLDEPTEGLDPVRKVKFRELLKSLKNEGKTIFINSHLLSEIEIVCDRVGVINNGTVIKIGGIKEFITLSDTYRVKVNKHLSESIKKSLNTYQIELNGDYIDIIVDNTEKLGTLMHYLREQDIDILAVEKHQKRLEEVFMELIKTS